MAKAKPINPPEEQLNVRFHLTWQEYFTAERFLLRQRQLVAPEQVFGAALVLLALTLLLAVGFKWFEPLMAAAGVVLMLTPLLRKGGLRRRWQREPLLGEEHVIAFSKNRIHYLLGEVESDLPWSYFGHWVESPAAFLLITGEDVFNLIPKRAFASDGEVSRFRNLAASRLKPVTQP
jgi:hypothetical protein